MSGHALHAAAHELDALEAFVHACVQQLPRLAPVAGFSASVRGDRASPACHDASAAAAQLPTRCAAYHTTCAAMLKQALAVLAPLSPRLARLTAQIWDLASLNVFALLQLAQAALGESAALLAQSEQSARAEAERRALEAERATRADRERELLRSEARTLRAELHTTRQRANRLAVERTQLRRVLAGLLDNSLEAGGGDGASRVVNEFEEDVAAVGAAEEQALYGVDGDALATVELAHPLERAAADLDQVLRALVEGDAKHVAVLNTMDRFVNSHAVGLLWRFGSEQQQHQLMARMLHSRHASTQTQTVDARQASVVLLRGVDASVGDQEKNEDQEDEEEEEASGEEEADSLASGGVSGRAALVTRARAIPASLRAQLSSRPRVHRVLELPDASRLVLVLLVDKLDADAAAVRARQPRAALHVFLKQSFLARYGVASLADYHLMELAKTALFHHERLRRSAAASTPTDSPPDALLTALTPSDRPHQADADAVRLALFARLCELVPFELPASGAQLPGSPGAGSMFTTALHSVVDLLGDVVELDAAFASLNDVERLDSRWWCPLGRATLLVSHHLAFIGRDALIDTTARLQALSGPVLGLTSRDEDAVVEVDVLLALFATAWLEYDLRLTGKLRDGFRRQLMLISPLALGQAAGNARASTSDAGRRRRSTAIVSAVAVDEDSTSESGVPPIETLMRVFAGLPDESVVPTVLEELRAELSTLLDAKQQQQMQQQPAKGRRTSRKTPSMMHLAGASVCIGGVSEKEFVFHALEVLRARRVGYGLRTNGRRLVRRRRALLRDQDGDEDEDGDGVTVADDGGSDALWADEQNALVPVTLDKLKPGLTRREW